MYIYIDTTERKFVCSCMYICLFKKKLSFTSGGLDSSVIVSITIEDVNDNHPQFYPLNYSTNVNVNLRPGQDIITVQARDEDSGNFSAIQYSIAGGNDDNLFSVDRYSGKFLSRQVLA